MATLAQILNPAAAILAAWHAAHKTTVGSLFPEFSDQDRKTPYLEYHLANLRENGQKYPQGDYMLPNGWTATLVNRAATTRGVNSDKHATICGAVVVAGALFWQTFSQARLPYHLIQNCQLTGYVPSTEGLEDITEIHLDLTISTRDDVRPE